MSAQECTAALKIQDTWREWQKSHTLCTCTTTFYPDGDKMIPEKHVCLRCYERVEEEKENASLKIQDAWRKYQESKDSCPICLKVIGEDSCKTKCGHRFCTGCLLKAVQRNGSCPLCRGELIETDEPTQEDIEYDQAYEHGYISGQRDAEEEFQPRMREEIDIATQKAYDDGVVQGRSLASEDMRLLREEIDKLKRINSRMREDIQFHTQRFYSPSI